jgi:hypothetical protein
VSPPVTRAEFLRNRLAEMACAGGESQGGGIRPKPANTATPTAPMGEAALTDTVSHERNVPSIVLFIAPSFRTQYQTKFLSGSRPYLPRSLAAPVDVVLVEDLLLQDLLDHVLQGDDPQGQRAPGHRLVVRHAAKGGRRERGER